MKKGFTLVEIIISIGLIVLIGTMSIIGFSIIKKNNREKALNNMSDEILSALRLYIETNEEAKNNIYNNYEGMAITLKQLENEGLIDFQDIDVSNGEDYVVAMLSNESDCSDITTVESWDLTNGPLYICSKSNGSQNLFSVGVDAKNLSKTTRETYYFRGLKPQNYVQLNGTGTKYRIISIEKDDSLILYHSETFGTTFNGFTLPISYTTTRSTTISNICINNALPMILNSVTDDTGIEKPVDINDFFNISLCDYLEKEVLIYNKEASLSKQLYISSWFGSYALQHYTQSSIRPSSEGNYLYYYNIIYNVSVNSGYKIHLKPCMKITGGSGDLATPYVLKNNCSN